MEKASYVRPFACSWEMRSWPMSSSEPNTQNWRLTMKLTDQQSLRINTQAGKPTRTQPQSVDLILRLKRLEPSTQRVVRAYLHDLRRNAPAARDIVREHPHAPGGC
jgi:hypothetical protein